VASNAASQPMSGLYTVKGMTGWLVIHASLTRVACVLCTFLIISFLVLALIAPVWIPVRAVKHLAPRPSATQLREDD
jgi:hypothetical protein